LQVAHDERVVHRDVKPGNILLEWGSGRAFLADFGLGRDLDFATAEQLCDGAGTPLYMPPEKLLGGACNEALGDIYALGVTLYEAVTLCRLFRVPESLPRPVWGLWLAKLEVPTPRAVRAGIPVALEAIILRTIAREPGARYGTAAELADDLERFVRGVRLRRRRWVA
jgi:serine/threonine protein kinase